MYVLGLIVCLQWSVGECYQHRLYSEKRYETLDECRNQSIILELHRADTDLKVKCMTEEEWNRLPPNENLPSIPYSTLSPPVAMLPDFPRR